MQLNKNDIYYYLSKSHFMNVNIYSRDFQNQFVNSGGDISYSFGGPAYSRREFELFNQSAKDLVINEYASLPILEGINWDLINSDGIYFDTLFLSDDFKFKIDAVVVQGGNKILIEFKNSTKWNDNLLIRYFTIMLAIGKESYDCGFRYVIYERSNKKGMVGTRFLDTLTLTGQTVVEFERIWKNDSPFQVLYLDSRYHKKDGTLLARVYKFIEEKFEEFSENFDDFVSEAKSLKETGTELLEEAKEKGEPFPNIINIDQRIKTMFKNGEFSPKDSIPLKLKEFFDSKISSMIGKDIIFYDFETLNPKMSLFDNYPSSGSGVAAQVSIYKSWIDKLTEYEKMDGLLIDTFKVTSMSDFYPIVEKLYKENAIYVTHSEHEKRILNVIRNHPGTPVELIDKIDYINENNFDTAVLFKLINKQNFSSIKIIEKYLKSQDGIYEKFELQDYSDLNVSNGFEAMDVFLNMQLFGDSEPYRMSDVKESMIEYCDQDVRMMIALLYWWKEVWLPRVSIIPNNE